MGIISHNQDRRFLMSYIDQLSGDDLLWAAIVAAIPGKRKRSGTSFVNINCPMCVSRGESCDTRMRCGIKKNFRGVGIYCFNCGFKTSWVPGETISRNLRDFMVEIGISSLEVKRLSHHMLTVRRMIERSSVEVQSHFNVDFTPSFKRVSLPPKAKSIEKLATTGCSDPDFLAVAEYLINRGDTVLNGSTYFWSPDQKHKMNRRIIIPIYHEGMLVGWSARSCDEKIRPKYWSNIPSDILFNSRVLTASRKYVIIVEGIFDAIAIDGISTLGAKLNEKQAAWINQSGKIPILVSDRDTQGQRMIDTALQYKWMVSFPRLRSTGWWDSDVKDVDDAVKRYGRIYTLRSIIETATNNEAMIKVKQKALI